MTHESVRVNFYARIWVCSIRIACSITRSTATQSHNHTFTVIVSFATKRLCGTPSILRIPWKSSCVQRENRLHTTYTCTHTPSLSSTPHMPQCAIVFTHIRTLCGVLSNLSRRHTRSSLICWTFGNVCWGEDRKKELWFSHAYAHHTHTHTQQKCTLIRSCMRPVNIHNTIRQRIKSYVYRRLVCTTHTVQYSCRKSTCTKICRNANGAESKAHFPKTLAISICFIDLPTEPFWHMHQMPDDNEWMDSIWIKCQHQYRWNRLLICFALCFDSFVCSMGRDVCMTSSAN